MLPLPPLLPPLLAPTTIPTSSLHSRAATSNPRAHPAQYLARQGVSTMPSRFNTSAQEAAWASLEEIPPSLHVSSQAVKLSEEEVLLLLFHTAQGMGGRPDRCRMSFNWEMPNWGCWSEGKGDKKAGGGV